MIRRHLVMLVAFLIVAALWAGTRLNGFSLAQPTQAEATRSPETRKWEYCTVAGLGYDPKRNSSSATISFFTATGRRSETLDCGSGNDPLAIALAKLGSEAWEVVGQVRYNYPGNPDGRPDTWLFKRSVP